MLELVLDMTHVLVAELRDDMGLIAHGLVAELGSTMRSMSWNLYCSCGTTVLSVEVLHLWLL